MAATRSRPSGSSSASHYAFPAGSVLNDETFQGYRRERHSQLIAESASFGELRNAVFSWAIQRRSNIHVVGDDGRDAGPVQAGLRARLSVPLLPGIRLSAPVRVLEVIDSPTTAGFAYATLPGHPERGEEAFLLHRHPDGTIELELRVLSRPAMPFALLAPIARLVQTRYTRRYLSALP